MVKEDLETVIDRLLDFVRTNNSCSLQQASKALALNQNQVERLALLLEESDLLEVQYTLMGIKLVHREQEEKKEEELKEKARVKANAILTQTQALEKQVSTSEHMVEFMQKDIAKRFDLARSILSNLEKKHDYTRAELEFARREVSAIKKELKAYKAGLKELNAKQERFEAELAKFEAKLAKARVAGPKKPGLFARFMASLPLFGKKEKPAEANAETERQKPLKEKPEQNKPAPQKKKCKKKESFLSKINPFKKKAAEIRVPAPKAKEAGKPAGPAKKKPAKKKAGKKGGKARAKRGKRK